MKRWYTYVFETESVKKYVVNYLMVRGIAFKHRQDCLYGIDVYANNAQLDEIDMLISDQL